MQHCHSPWGVQVHGRQPEASGGAWVTESTAKLRLEATHVACGSPATAAVLSMFAALHVGRTANAEAAARQSSSQNGQRRVRAATGPGAVLAPGRTTPPRDHLRQHGAGPHHRTQTPLEPPGCTSHFQCLGVVARSRAEITHAKHGAGLPQNTTTPLEPAGCTSHFQCLGVGARSRAGRGLTKVPGGAVTTTSCSGVQTSSKHT